jgi:plasmid maintenance system antidote protein VapI
VQSVQYIGKEANKWEEQYFTGLDEDAQIVYGTSSESLDVFTRSINRYGIRKVAKIAKVSERHVHNLYHGKTVASEKMLTKVLRAAAALDSASAKEQKLCELIRRVAHEKGLSIRRLSAQLAIDPSNMSKILNGSRRDLGQLKEILTYLERVTG